MDSKYLSGVIRLLIFVVAGLIISQIVTLGLAHAYGYDFATIKEMGSSFIEEADASFIKLSLFLGHIFTFIIPSLLFIYFFYKEDRRKSLNLKISLNLKYLLIAFLFLVISYPAVNYSYIVNSWIPLADWMHGQEDATASTLQKVLAMDNPGALLINLFIVALIPAIGEELLFRGLLQKLIEKGTNKGHLAVWIASIAFSFFHLQFEGFLPRLLLGLILGYSFLWTKNLWVPMILHFFNNAIPILGLYFYNTDLAATDPGSGPEMKWYYGLLSLCLGIIVGFYFLKSTKEDERT